uniref:Uncharacterized protein n=1 Tax=Anguilla anguilla TaxID=7936 RepID=A0A0E9XWH4_ANGAN
MNHRGRTLTTLMVNQSEMCRLLVI